MPCARAALRRRVCRAASMSRRRRGALLIGLALALGGLAASDVSRREAAVRGQLAPLVDVVVAGRDLGPAHRVRPQDLALRRIPAHYAPVGAASAPEEVVGRRPASAVPRGAYLGAAELDDESAPGPPPMRRGERAVEVAGTGSAPPLGPGGRGGGGRGPGGRGGPPPPPRPAG